MIKFTISLNFLSLRFWDNWSWTMYVSHGPVNEPSYLWTPWAQLRKGLFMFVCLVNKSSSCPSLNSTIKEVKLKHSNVFMNMLVIMRFDLTTYNIIYFSVYSSKIRLEIGFCKFVNIFIWYPIIICCLLIILIVHL